jgi:hypothetical protein
MSTDESRPPEPWVGTPAGRETNGFFARGNSIAKGNPQAKHMAELRKAAREAGTPERVKAFMDRCYDMFMDDRDLQAGIVWAQYTLGKPTQSVQIDDEGEGGVVAIQVIRTMAGGLPSASD